MSTDPVRDLLTSHHLGTLATIRRSGRPQLSVVTHAFDGQREVIRVSTAADRAKTANLRRDPRATYLVMNPHGWGYAVADCRAELLPVTTAVDDASADELVDIYRAISGEHPDWDEFRAAMIIERRLPVHLHVERLNGWL